MGERQGLIQFFQHAHHRVEGWLLDFQERLNLGLVDAGPLRLAVDALRQHMFAEETLVFPRIRGQLPGPVANLEDMHTRLWDITDELSTLVHEDADAGQIRMLTRHLMDVLAAHSAEEDFGVYSELTSILGEEAAWTLMLQAEKAAPPTDWVPSSGA